jgi:outer membrane protein assembly factor BamB
LTALFARHVLPGDWPQHLGPARNGLYPDTDFPWTAGALKSIWTREIGAGLAAPSAAAGKLYLFHRRGNEELLECFLLQNGKPEWSAKYPTSYRDDFGFDEGPRAAPCVSGGRVYTHGAEGTLTCFDAASGKRIWQRDTMRDFQVPKGFFGAACSPLVYDNHVLLGVGGPSNGGIVAFDTATGQTRWSALNDEAGYSSPIIATLAGEPHAIFFTRAGLAVLNPRDGKVVSQFRWRSRSQASVNAATPVVSGNQVFLTASYGTGAVLLDLANPGQPKPIWSNDDSLSAHYATPALKDGFLYGYHGRQEMGASLTCIEWQTGKVRWTIERFGAGSILLASSRILMVRENGEIVIAEATPAAYRPLAKYKALDGVVRAYPALAAGTLILRNENKLVALRP